MEPPDTKEVYLIAQDAEDGKTEGSFPPCPAFREHLATHQVRQKAGLDSPLVCNMGPAGCDSN